MQCEVANLTIWLKLFSCSVSYLYILDFSSISGGNRTMNILLLPTLVEVPHGEVHGADTLRILGLPESSTTIHSHPAKVR